MSEQDTWVRETLFGTWFLRTEIWSRYVLAPALSELSMLLGPERPRFASILDVGCGEGAAFSLLESHFHPDRLVGVDIDLSLIARAETEARRCSLPVELCVGNASKLDIPDASMDMVFCHQTVHHLSDQEGAVHEFYRVLRRGGVLLFAESCRSFIRLLRVRALFRHPVEVQKSADDYLGLLRSGGFEFGPRNVSTPYPFWCRRDFGLMEWLGRTVPAQREPTLLQVAAFRRG